VIASCESDYDPYADRSADASQFVIPDAKDWNADKRCPSGGDCPGVVTADSIERFDWFTAPVARLAAEADAESGFAFLDPLMAK
jgi:hypothetical protein